MQRLLEELQVLLLLLIDEPIMYLLESLTSVTSCFVIVVNCLLGLLRYLIVGWNAKETVS